MHVFRRKASSDRVPVEVGPEAAVGYSRQKSMQEDYLNHSNNAGHSNQNNFISFSSSQSGMSRSVAQGARSCDDTERLPRCSANAGDWRGCTPCALSGAGQPRRAAGRRGGRWPPPAASPPPLPPGPPTCWCCCRRCRCHPFACRRLCETWARETMATKTSIEAAPWEIADSPTDSTFHVVLFH